MKNLKIAVTTLMIVTSVIGMSAPKKFKSRKKTNKPAAVGMANPASVYCEKQGGKSITVKDSKGNERGICKFKNGTQVDEWDYYRENNK